MYEKAKATHIHARHFRCLRCDPTLLWAARASGVRVGWGAPLCESGGVRRGPGATGAPLLRPPPGAV
eukprot:5962535-Pleurochrysis_carterae.AAC.1